MKRIITLTSVLLIIAACDQTQAPVDPSVITSRSDAWEAALNAKDADALADLYTSDTRLMPPGEEMASGRDAARAIFGGMIDAGIGGTLTSVEAKVNGDTGYNAGVYKLMTGDTLVDTGKFIEVWQRGDDGQWRISNDIWNSDGTVAAADDGEGNPHMLIVHDVADGDHWMAAWRGEDSRHQLFEKNGAAHVHTFRSADDPNVTALIVAVTDMDALRAMLESEEGQAAAAEDGVDMESMSVLMESE